MPEMKEYAPGTPSWVDLGSPDLGASTRFYGRLFGWEAQTSTDPAAGGYVMFTLRGKNVAGAAPLMNEGQPPAWTTYVSVGDADAAVARARDAGATVFLEPMDVLDVGRMAIFADPSGAVIAVWQPMAHKGADLVNEPGTLCWNELATRDLDGAMAFYSKVFGWKPDTSSTEMGSYTEWKLDGRSVAGMMEMGPQIPPEVPPHWMVYFAVADCDATTEQAAGLGGTTIVPPMDIPPGRFAVLQDPQGAVFSVITMSAPLS